MADEINTTQQESRTDPMALTAYAKAINSERAILLLAKAITSLAKAQYEDTPGDEGKALRRGYINETLNHINDAVVLIGGGTL